MCKSHGIFRSYKDRSRKAVSLESLLKEENRKRAREEEMRSRKEEILVGKRELVEQLKSALPYIEKRLQLAIRDRDLVAFAYNYCHYMVRMNASGRMRRLSSWKFVSFTPHTPMLQYRSCSHNGQAAGWHRA